MATRKDKGATPAKERRALKSEMPLDDQWTSRTVRFEGTTPILFGKPPAEIGPDSKQSGALTGETDIRRIARAHMHANENGDPCVPMDMLWACLKQADRHFKHGKRQLSTSQTTILHFFMELQGDPMIRLRNGSRDLVETDMQVQIDTAFNANKGGAKVTSYRARFDRWSIEVPINLNISTVGGLSLRDFQDIFRVAGIGYGMGSRRPERGGTFGRFRFDNWKE